MKLRYEIGLAFAFALAATGCQSTPEGTKETIRDNSISASNKIKEGIDNGSNIAKNAEENLGAAASLTPRIKNAINAEAKLNSDGNLIDVDSTKEKVSLNGHVASADLKALAESVARTEMVKAKAEQKLVNNLVVQKPAATK